MENMVEEFKKNKYVFVENALGKDICEIATTYVLIDEKNNFTPDPDPTLNINGHTIYGDQLMESILLFIQSKIEKITGMDLFPTYSYFRVYRQNDELKRHIDRESCEISASICLGFKYNDDYDGWPLYANDNAFFMNEGDMLVYKGQEVTHYRYPFYVDSKDYYHAQLFVHYVNAHGQNANLKYDGREYIGQKITEDAILF